MEKKCENCKKSYFLSGLGALGCNEARLCVKNNLFEPVEELQGDKEREMVNHPSHYNQGKFEAIDVIEDWQLNFNLGNTVKYISRAGHKDDIVQDLKKALWYLDREIKRLEKGE